VSEDIGDDSFNASRAEVFEALGHPTRIRLLQCLSEKPLAFSELKRAAGLEGNGVLSFHLGKLAGLVKLNQEGAYALTDEGREALRIVEASRIQARDAHLQRPSVTLPHLKAVLATLVVILLVVSAVSAIEYSQIQGLDSRTQSSPPAVTTTATVTTTSTITTASTVVETTTVTTTSAATGDSPPGPTVYEANQVVPIDVNTTNTVPSDVSFGPDSVRLVLGINNTVSFVNDGDDFAAVDSILWPANGTGFSSPILRAGTNWSVTLLTPGVYNYTDYIRPLARGSITVVAVPGISASTDSNNTVSINSLSLCSSSCPGGQSFSAGVAVRGSSPIVSLEAYLNGTGGQLALFNSNATNYTFQYKPDLAGSSWTISPGKVYFVEIVVVFADNQLAVATASASAN